MNHSTIWIGSSASLSQFVRNLRYGAIMLLSLSCFSPIALAQPTLSIVANSEVSDEQVFHLITTFQLEESDLKESMKTLMKIKSSTLEQRIANLANLKTKWSKLADRAEEIANQKQRESDALFEQMSTSGDQESVGNNLLVLSASAADTLYLQCQSERQRIGWEIAAEEATLETMKKLAGGPQSPGNTAVLEGKVRLAEAALKTAKDLFDISDARAKLGVNITREEFLQAQGNYQIRTSELEVAKAELASQGAPSKSVSEAKVRLAEAFVNSAKAILDSRTERNNKGLLKTEFVREAEGNYQQQLINLDIAKAELNSQDSKNLSVLEGKVRVAEVAIEAAKIEFQNKQKLFEKNVISQSELALSEAPLKMRTVELEIAKAELHAQSQQAALSSSDAVVKSLVNLAQLKGRDQVLKTQLRQLSKAKQQIAAIEKLRSEAAGQRTISERYRELAMEEQPNIDRLESLKEALQAALQSSSNDVPKKQESESTSQEALKDK